MILENDDREIQGHDIEEAENNPSNERKEKKQTKQAKQTKQTTKTKKSAILTAKSSTSTATKLTTIFNKRRSELSNDVPDDSEVQKNNSGIYKILSMLAYLLRFFVHV